MNKRYRKHLKELFIKIMRQGATIHPSDASYVLKITYEEAESMLNEIINESNGEFRWM